MSSRYLVIGAGRQGTAAAYDLGLFGDAAEIVIADLDRPTARSAATRVNELLSRPLAREAGLDVRDADRLASLLGAADVCVSAVPYFLNLEITRAAIAAGTHFCDLGGNTGLVRRQLELDAEARAAGVSVIPDCGQVPGMGTSLMVYTMGLLDEPEEVRMWDGGLPQKPTPPWNYALTFNIAGLTNEYDGHAVFLRDGTLTEVECFDPAGYELLDFPEPIGRLEAFVTAGGTSTAPWTFLGSLRTFENRTLRYPGHAAQWQAYRDAGLFLEEAIDVGGVEVVPRALLHRLLAERIEADPETRDLVLVRVEARGRHAGVDTVARLDLVDRFDEETGFTAMQRTTGFDVAIVAALMARGRTPVGAIAREASVDPRAYVDELRRRGFDLAEEIHDAT